jgi:hypothetical protein
MTYFLKKKFIFLFLVLMVAAFGVEGVSANSDQIKALREELEKSPHRSVALRELSILEAQEGKWGLARGYLTAAIQSNPLDTKSWQIWSYLKQESPIRSTFWSYNSWQTLYQNFTMWVEFWTLTFIFLILLIISLIVWIKWYGRYRRARKIEAPFEFNLVKLGANILFIILVGLIWINKLSFEYSDRAIVVQETGLKTMYGENSPDLAQMLPGMESRVLKSIEGWLFVMLLDGRVGWIKSESAYIVPSVLGLL